MENNKVTSTFSYQMQEAFDLLINPVESSFGKAGRAWTILMIIIQPALVDTAQRFNCGTREELENKDIPELLKDVQSALLQANDYEYAGDLRLKEAGKKEIQDTIKETYTSRLELAHNWNISKRPNKQYYEWAINWKKLMELMDHPKKGELISACNSLIRSLKTGYQPKIDEWLFALANTKMAVAARAYFLITTRVHPVLLKYCEDHSIILTNDRNDIKYILDNIKKRIELEPEFKDKLMTKTAIRAAKDARDDLAHNKNYRARSIVNYRDYFNGVSSLYNYLGIDSQLRDELDSAAKRLVYRSIP